MTVLGQDARAAHKWLLMWYSSKSGASSTPQMVLASKANDLVWHQTEVLLCNKSPLLYDLPSASAIYPPLQHMHLSLPFSPHEGRSTCYYSSFRQTLAEMDDALIHENQKKKPTERHITNGPVRISSESSRNELRVELRWINPTMLADHRAVTVNANRAQRNTTKPFEDRLKVLMVDLTSLIVTTIILSLVECGMTVFPAVMDKAVSYQPAVQHKGQRTNRSADERQWTSLLSLPRSCLLSYE